LELLQGFQLLEGRFGVVAGLGAGQLARAKQPEHGGLNARLQLQPLFAGVLASALDGQLLVREQQAIESEDGARLQNDARAFGLSDAVRIIARGRPTQRLVGVANGTEA
jgi:hypothetical protein